MRALCGQGVAEAYGAILSLALREGIGEACRWPVNKIGEPALAEILSAVSTDRAVFRAAYDRMLETGEETSGPIIRLPTLSVGERQGRCRGYGEMEKGYWKTRRPAARQSPPNSDDRSRRPGALDAPPTGHAVRRRRWC